MDPITHGLVGIALSAFSGHTMQLNDPVFLGCTLGAMLPDLDILAYLKGRLNYLLNHRGASHSLLALTGMSLVLGTALYLIYPTTSWWTVVLWTLIGTLSHSIMDLLNSFGAELLWPFSRKKITVDMIMLTDPIISCLFLGSFMASLRSADFSRPSASFAIFFSLLYLGYRQIGRLKTRSKLMRVYSIKSRAEVKVLPAMYHPFAWNFILFQGDSVRFGIVRNQMPSICRVLPKFDKDNPSVSNALEGNLAEMFCQFTPYYHVVAHNSDSGECLVEFVDLRYWTKGDFLYTGNVYLNENGEISYEIFNHFPNQEGVLLSY
ncbi:metal-dependent hydrolase [Desulfosporosinus sp. FKA]|uniref:metal-dependent hydrolase n=1 Tax=Desulfosporosinus sp. FKA TaxID=1969834 RepID=UPI000B49E06E|nr:metal-dependent hydrolase [Desulfosporosinus sp. FKA]